MQSLDFSRQKEMSEQMINVHSRGGVAGTLILDYNSSYEIEKFDLTDCCSSI